jgi:hypothetical protein
MLDALGTEPQVLGPALNAIVASPVTPTAEQLEDATVHIISQRFEEYKKQQRRVLELDKQIIHEKQIMLLGPRELDEETDSDIHGLNVTEEIRNTEEELRTQNKEMVDLLSKERTDNAMESVRHAGIIKEYETKEEDRRISRISAIQVSRDVQEICKNLKDQHVSIHDYFDKYRRLNHHPGHIFETEKRMETSLAL